MPNSLDQDLFRTRPHKPLVSADTHSSICVNGRCEHSHLPLPENHSLPLPHWSIKPESLGTAATLDTYCKDSLANTGKSGRKGKKTITSLKMDALSYNGAMNTILKDLKDQVKDRLLWRKSIYVVIRSQIGLDDI